MKNKIFSVLFVVLVMSLFANYKLLLINKQYKSFIPYLLVGEKINNLDLIDKEAQMINSKSFSSGVSVICVFYKQCSPCDKNIIYWKKIASMFEKRIQIIGVVINSPTEAFSFEEKAKLNFKVYVPDNLTKYTKDMRVLLDQSQTIVLEDGEVKRVIMGNLTSQNAIELINLIKGLL